jgi:pSer/pThr/pTyr-binding forkhead associated (FHA) protein
MNCPSCGEEVAPGSTFCANCGTRLPATPPPAPPQPPLALDRSAPLNATDTLVSIMPHSLLVLAGPEKGKTFPLGETTRLGRDMDNEVMLTDPRISRRHAEIELKGQEYVIFDMGSPNGLFVNAVRVTGPQMLRDGDNIRLGDTVLVFSPQPFGGSERKVENITWEPDVTPINRSRPLSARLSENATVPLPLPPVPTPPAVEPLPAKTVAPPPLPAVDLRPAKAVAPPPPPPAPVATAKKAAAKPAMDTVVDKKKAGNMRWFLMSCLLIVVLFILLAVLVWLAIPRVNFSFPSA